jgi:hypothetical protein
MKEWKVFPSGFITIFVMLILITPLVIADSEPNNSIEEAEVIALGQIISGSLDVTSDEYDYYNISLNADQDVIVDLDGPEDADFDINIYDSGGTHLTGSTYDLDADEMIKFLPTETDYYFISIWTYDGTGSYTMSMHVPQTTAKNSYTLTEAIDNRYIEVDITGVYDGIVESFDLKNGNKVFYGPCIEITIESFVSNDLEVLVPAGLTLISTDEDIENKIVTKSESLQITSYSQKSFKLLAMSINMLKMVPSIYSPFDVGTMATGDLLKIAQALDSGDSQGVAGQIAVWMVSDNATSTDVEQLGATKSQISAAKLKLNEAGIKAPEEDDPDDGDFYSNPLNLICLTLIIVVVILFIIGSISKRRRDKDTASQTVAPAGSQDPSQAPPTTPQKGQTQQITKSSPEPSVPPSDQPDYVPPHPPPRPPPPSANMEKVKPVPYPGPKKIKNGK